MSSRIPIQDRRTGDQQLLAPNASTAAPGHESGNESERKSIFVVGNNVYSPVAHGGSEGAWSEDFSRSISDLPSDQRDSNIHNQGENEDQGPGVQQPSEAATERTSGGGQDDGHGHGPAQSGTSKGQTQ